MAINIKLVSTPADFKAFVQFQFDLYKGNKFWVPPIKTDEVKALQKEFGKVTYIFLSLDKTQDAWKKGIEKYNVQAQHYYMQSGWKGPFGEFVQLDWIPRYMVVDKQGKIKLFKAIEADDKQIRQIL